MKPDLSVRIGKLKLKNPVTVASGTFGYGEEFKDLCDINKLGALITKTVTREPWEGNKPPRVAETPSGMLNAIGLENPGIDKFISEKGEFLKALKTPVIVSIGGKTDEEFAYLARRLDRVEWVSALEVNISCPNVGEWKNKRLFAQDEEAAAGVVAAVKESTGKPVITKLSPNVTDISAIALAVEKAGSDAVSLINTLFGMAVDIERRKPLLGNVVGGLSGPAIKPVALRMVWDVYNSVDIPVIGIGGIISAHDVIAFMLCGASAVSVGTYNFVEPDAPVEIADGIKNYMKKHRIGSLKELIGGLKGQ